MFRTVLKNLYNKTSFRSTDLNYEINPFRFLIFSYANNSNHKRRPKEGCPQSADCAVPGSKPLRGVLFTTGGDDCPTQAEKLPNRPAIVTNTGRGYPRAKLNQAAGMFKNQEKITHSQSSPEKDF